MDLVIVGDRSDFLAIAVVNLAKEQGFVAEILDVCAAAQLFTVSIDSGCAIVTPDIPLLLRMPAPSTIREDFDASFQYGECLATLWAAAALMKSTVINRPTPFSAWGRASNSTVLTEVRAGLSPEGMEVFSLHPPAPAQQLVNQQWYLQDMTTFTDTPWPEIPGGEGPYRAYYSDSEPAYEMVVVLGEQAWRSTTAPLEHLQLESRSISVMKPLDITFGVVIWSISPDLDHAVLFRVNPFPSLQQVQFVWHSLAPALIQAFFP
ncbi:hypothetical protein [Calothrix sp. PCC 7507]|uniref:hypothetical protein n=1 Tax=Calothrix sp. PCC 7507 TaxID=99598 RepID=UPI00029F239A|nr:hypothetical protein [Calothrix sp. PCC 7507]AFY31477.1 hypothetical protein Cal7507_0999 [Calothrix sp. PCC 7507]